VHQILDHYFLSSKTVLKKDLRSIARHCSDTERKADKAEQEFNELKRLRFLKDRFEKRILRPKQINFELAG
jgi:exoribonuclease R